MWLTISPFFVERWNWIPQLTSYFCRESQSLRLLWVTASSRRFKQLLLIFAYSGRSHRCCAQTRCRAMVLYTFRIPFNMSPTYLDGAYSSGPRIDFRGGRVDATAANAPGVPKPFESLDAHTAAFARMGLNQTEMITLVACGHSFGGVKHSAFPDIVPPQNGTDDVQATFDTTPFTFDNAVYVILYARAR